MFCGVDVLRVLGIVCLLFSCGLVGLLVALMLPFTLYNICLLFWWVVCGCVAMFMATCLLVLWCDGFGSCGWLVGNCSCVIFWFGAWRG